MHKLAIQFNFNLKSIRFDIYSLYSMLIFFKEKNPLSTNTIIQLICKQTFKLNKIKTNIYYENFLRIITFLLQIVVKIKIFKQWMS